MSVLYIFIYFSIRIWSKHFHLKSFVGCTLTPSVFFFWLIVRPTGKANFLSTVVKSTAIRFQVWVSDNNKLFTRLTDSVGGLLNRNLIQAPEPALVTLQQLWPSPYRRKYNLTQHRAFQVRSFPAATSILGMTICDIGFMFLLHENVSHHLQNCLIPDF